MALNSHTSGGYWHSILTPRGLLGRGLETRGLLGCYHSINSEVKLRYEPIHEDETGSPPSENEVSQNISLPSGLSRD